MELSKFRKVLESISPEVEEIVIRRMEKDDELAKKAYEAIGCEDPRLICAWIDGWYSRDKEINSTI